MTEPHLLSVGDEPVRDLGVRSTRDVAVNSNDTSGNADLSRANTIPKPAYAAAILSSP